MTPTRRLLPRLPVDRWPAAPVLAAAGLAAACAGAGVLLGIAGGRLFGPAPRPPAAAPAPAAAAAPPALPVPRWNDGLERASADVKQLAQRVRATGDAGGHPFAILDKKQARLYLFDAASTLVGTAPVLLGQARGDDSVPGIGERPIDQVRPFERTTPAGRFFARHGRNAAGEDVIWVDYGAAVSMHRVRATVAAERRLQRLASPSARDNRISYGCINLPPKFYELSVLPLFAARGGVVYALPETRPTSSVFPSLFPE